MTEPLMTCTPVYKTSSQLHEQLNANIGARLKNKEDLLRVARYLTQSPKRKTALSQEKVSEVVPARLFTGIRTSCAKRMNDTFTWFSSAPN